MKVSFHFRTNTEEIELMKVPTSFTYNAYLSVQIFFRVTVSELSISHPLFESWDNSDKFLSCRDSIYVALSYDDGEIEKRGRQQIFRFFLERRNLKLYTCKCTLAKTTTCKLALIFRNIKWPRNQASRASWRSFGNRYIRSNKQQALLRNFFPSRKKDILTLLNQKSRDFC